MHPRGKEGHRFSASELKMSVNTLKTGISLRDRHLKEKLNEEVHPYIIVSEITASEDRGRGKLTIAGITQPVEFQIKNLGDNFAQATFRISLPNYKISGISYMGVGVEDHVEIIAVVPYEDK